MDQISAQSGTVPKREPCIKCDKPIFLAERMKIGERFYHRRCLKCARCNAQLSLGSFYETEVDGEFCCETCPDEEDEDEEEEISITDQGTSKVVPNLIADRLAMFEKRDTQLKSAQNWRNSSLSDEQKSQTIKNMAIFMSDQVGNDSIPPPLPSLPPPPMSLKESFEEDIVENSNKETNRNNIIVENELKETHIKPSIPVKVIDNVVIEPVLDKNDIIPSNSSVKDIGHKEEEVIENESENALVKPSIGDSFNETITNVSSEQDVKIEIKEEHSENLKSESVNKNDSKEGSVQEESTEVLLRPPHETVNRNVSNIRSIFERKSSFENEGNFVKPRKVCDLKGNSGEKISKALDEPKPIETVEPSKAIDLEENKLDKSVQEESHDTTIVRMEKIECPIDSIKEKEDPVALSLDLKVDVRESEQIEFTKEEENVIIKEETTSKNDDSEEISASLSQKIVEEKLKEEVTPTKNAYPSDLNPFGSDDEEEKVSKPKNLNPFDSDDDEVELEKIAKPQKKVSTNPFGSEDEDEEESHSSKIKTPVPTPRKTLMTQKPEPSPRFQLRLASEDYQYGSLSSLGRNTDFRGSTNSISSSSSANTSGTYRAKKKRRAPLPPGLMEKTADDHSEMYLTPNRKYSNASAGSQDSSMVSNSASPKMRKKRPAPAPPKENIRPITPTPASETQNPEHLNTTEVHEFKDPSQEMSHSTPLKENSLEKSLYFSANGEKMSVIREGASKLDDSEEGAETTKRRIIPLDDRLLNDVGANEHLNANRKKIIPLEMEEEGEEEEDLEEGEENEIKISRQWEKVKDNKESDNRNRQSISSNDGHGDLDRFYIDKSSHGKWKRRKGPAPSLPVPPKRVLEMLPLQEIKHELEVIEVQQQGLEKQGVQLEKMIREKCETGEGPEDRSLDESSLSSTNKNTKEVEDLIMQLFDLVVEKNELFRRQAELMYLRRQHRLEQEQADLEYEIRVLMAQPECNRTDSDKAREEAMIARLVEVVQQRNEVVDSLEMDRIREKKEDIGIKQEIEKHTAKWEEELQINDQKPVKLSKKEKKAMKEAKKLKNKKHDVDKDDDETELGKESGTNTLKAKKKKKKFLII